MKCSPPSFERIAKMFMGIVSSRLIFLLLLMSVATSLHVGCTSKPPNTDLKVGGLYSIDDEEGSFRVVKILVLDDSAVHIAMYANKFPARPTTVDPASLSFGSVNDGEDFGMMHLPLSREVFLKDRPVFISQTTVTEEELEGYEMWKEGGGEVFR
jgi:hypothetical protein